MGVLEEVYMPDSSAILSGLMRKKIEEDAIKGKVVVHISLVRIFERNARDENSPMGLVGLRELELLRKQVEAKHDYVSLEYTQDLPQSYRSATFQSVEEVDVMLRELALEWNAILVTSDEIQFLASKALGVRVLYEKLSTRELSFEKYFDNETMSIHLKEGTIPYAKKGAPGNWRFVALRNEPVTREELEALEREILERARNSEEGFIEIDRAGSTIVQLKHYRIVITRPPFSDGMEITIVRPLVRLRLEDYRLPKKLLERLETRAEGILIAGAPGMGKTTFAQALAEYYSRKGKVIKTIESPRDMQLPPHVTQYSKSHGTSEEIHDVLLLSRPDYTFFDEMRDTKDFELYADLRLAGVGMVGVVHATTPIDAIQRFIGRVELGMIPSIIDTVIFIRNGKVEKVYELETVVKIPHGLREVDLARPVVVVRDFLTGEPEYEIYVFGERTFVVPVKRKESPREERIKRAIARTMAKYLPRGEYDIQISEDGLVSILVEPEYFNSLSAKLFKKLRKIGRKMGVEIDVRPRV